MSLRQRGGQRADLFFPKVGGAERLLASLARRERGEESRRQKTPLGRTHKIPREE